MVPTEKPLDNPINWSFKVARIWAIDVRVHVVFIIAAFVLLAMELPKEGSGDPRSFGQVAIDALGIYAILFAIVLLHEFGHCWGARRVGGEAEEILIWPLGGLASVSPPHDARSHLVTAVAGPTVNVIICGIFSGVIVLWVGRLGAVPWNPIHPMWPADTSIIATLTTAQLWTIRVFGLSYFILLINMLPVFPFDGGRVLQSLLWPSKGYRESMMIATATGMIGAIVVGIIGFFLEESWVLLMIAGFGYLTCMQQRRMIREEATFTTDEFGYDFSRGYASFDQPQQRIKKPGPIARWKVKRSEQKAERQRLEKTAHQQRVDEILRKIAADGIDSLTPSERRTLEAETKRKRSTDND